MRVLFVEDEPNDYLMYINAVSAEAAQRGGEMDHVRTLEDALRRLRSDPYDVVILDLNIPLGEDCPEGYKDCEMNGKYVVDYLHTHDASHVRVVCLTNYALRARGELRPFPSMTILAKSCKRDVVVKAVFP